MIDLADKDPNSIQQEKVLRKKGNHGYQALPVVTLCGVRARYAVVGIWREQLQ